MLPGAAPSLHYAEGRDAVRGPGGNVWVCSIKLAPMAFSFTTSPALLKGCASSQPDHVTAIPTQNATTAACSGVPFPCCPAVGDSPGACRRYRPFAAAGQAWAACTRCHSPSTFGPNHQIIFTLAKTSRFASLEEPVGPFPRWKPRGVLLPQQPASASRGTRHPLGSHCPSKRR